jgi:predicted ATP-grasp superfamily ATP-dependent carboligase
LDVLVSDRTLLGNPASVVRRARDARALPGAPAVRTDAPRDGEGEGEWLVKPRASGGGHGVRRWRRGERVPRRAVLQEFVPGAAGSVVFTPDGVLGVTRQLIGDPAFGADGFRYCGNILLDNSLIEAHHDALAARVTAAFGLTGVNGVDVVDRVPIEVNPRYTAAMELVERRDGVSIATAHATGRIGDRRVGRGTVGKAIVYARQTVTVGDTRDWLGDDTVADIPMPGTRVPRGRPICTVFVAGRDADECYARLVVRAEGVYGTLRRAAA